MPSPQPSLRASHELGKYRLIAELARGGMGNVYLGVAQGPGGFHKLVAVKDLRPEFAGDEAYVAMFLEEARLAARLAHPNIVQTNEVGSDEGRHFMVMEYLEGRSLYRVAKNGARLGGLPLGANLRIIAEALRGLHHAHELRGFDREPLGIVHRDVSPLNILVTFDGQAKVLDFGVAKSLDSAFETQAGIVKGRIAYMAPEQARGGQVDRRADVYAAGVMIWEAAAGRRLWAGKRDVEILTSMIGEGPPPLLSALPGTEPALAALCQRAMARDPAARHATAAELLEDLERIIAKRDDAMSMREVGSLVSLIFESERQRMHAVIDDALTQTRGSPRSGVMAARSVRPSGSAPVISVETPSSLEDFASIPSLAVATPSAGAATFEPTFRSASAIHMPAAAAAVEPPRMSARRRLAIVGTAALLPCAALILIRAASALSPQAAAPTSHAAAAAPATVDRQPVTSPPVTVPPPGTPTAESRASTTPSNAGATRPSPSPRPASQPAARAAKVAATEAPRATAAAETAPTEATRATVDPAGGRAPQRPIVTNNPYGSP